MNDDIKELPLEEKIEQIFESSWVNEFNYLENLMQRTRICLCDLQQELQRKDNIINELKEWLDSAEKMNSFDEYDLGMYKGYKATLYKIKELEKM